jgi:hypothetical protein
MKWIGAGVALLGWVVTIGGLRVAGGSGGRIFFALLGIGVSLFGILYVLPAAFNKTAFWKKSTRTYAGGGIATLSSRSTMEPDFSASSAMEPTR